MNRFASVEITGNALIKALIGGSAKPNRFALQQFKDGYHGGHFDDLILFTGDLTISVFVLYNYLEANSKVPWEDLRYLFGEIMYGGHITDDWDRRLCNAYLEELMQPDLVIKWLIQVSDKKRNEKKKTSHHIHHIPLHNSNPHRSSLF